MADIIVDFTVETSKTELSDIRMIKTDFDFLYFGF